MAKKQQTWCYCSLCGHGYSGPPHEIDGHKLCCDCNKAYQLGVEDAVRAEQSAMLKPLEETSE